MFRFYTLNWHGVTEERSLQYWQLLAQCWKDISAMALACSHVVQQQCKDQFQDLSVHFRTQVSMRACLVLIMGQCNPTEIQNVERNRNCDNGLKWTELRSTPTANAERNGSSQWFGRHLNRAQDDITLSRVVWQLWTAVGIRQTTCAITHHVTLIQVSLCTCKCTNIFFN